MRAIEYSRADSLEMALEAYTSFGAEARYIAGGTTLFDLMKLRVLQPTHLIDITGIPALDSIETDGDVLRFGALARMSDVAHAPVVHDEYPVLAESLLRAASQQLRNMATVGGNLLQKTRCAYYRAGPGVFPCNKRNPGSGCAALEGMDRGHAVFGISEACRCVAAGDWPVALTSLNASVEIFGPDGTRTLPIRDLYRLPEDTPEHEFNLKTGELVTAITVPKTPAGVASTYHKIRDRESYAFALASAAVSLELDGAVVQDVHIALGGVATRPWAVPEAEDALRGRELTLEAALEAGHLAFEGAQPGHHNGFKLELGARVVADALMIASERSQA